MAQFETDIEALLEATQEIPGMGIIFSGMLDSAVTAKIIDKKQRTNILVVWENWDGTLEKFIRYGMKPLLKPHQFKLLVRRIYAKNKQDPEWLKEI